MPSTDIPAFSTLFDLSGQTIIVTGASGNIGAGIAMRLAQAGANIGVHYHNGAEAAQSVVDAIIDDGGHAASFGCDLYESGAPKNLISEIAAKFGAVHGVVNNAGIQPVEGFSDISQDSFVSMMGANVAGPFALIQALAQHRSGAGGAVVNIASIEGLQPAAGHSHYAASKAALIMLTRAAALELGKDGIRVNSISPGLIHCDGIEQGWPEGVERWKNAAPLGRLGQPEDIADAALFLLSPAARWISGSNLVVDGGVMCHPTW